MKKDYCTGWDEGNWSDCCENHDKDYGENSTKTRLQADIDLLKCVWKRSKINSVLMFIGVRLFGSRYYKRNK